MGGIRVISTTTIHAHPHHHHHHLLPTIHLTPWDLKLLRIGTIQRGLLFHNPKPHNHVASNVVQHLHHSLSSTLHFFPPLAGRLSIVQHPHHHSSSVSILCNNAGALFVHAVADHTTVSDILDPVYVPPILHQFFQLNGVSNDKGTSNPLLAVQVTELVDGVFIACSINHCAVDGTSFWHFFNSWAEISRGLNAVSNPPVLERWFPSDVNPPIWFPSYTEEMRDCDEPIHSQPSPQAQRIFHFTKEKIGELKAKANAEVNDNKITISSLQAVLSHIWRGIIRNQGFDPEEEVVLILPVGVRQRMIEPPLGGNYFGNAIQSGRIRMKAEELVEGGVGKGAVRINRSIGLHTQEMVKEHYECWIKEPVIVKPGNITGSALMVNSSPRFDIYGNDFGWGKPVAVRSRPGLLSIGRITLLAGAEEGSMDVDVCVAYEILEAMAHDSQFMDM